MLSKEREIFKNIYYYQRLNKKDELSKKIDYGYLKFIVNSSGLETDFSELKGRVAFLDNTKKREISIEEARIKQKESNRYLKKIRTGNESEKKTLANINRLFNWRNNAIKFVDDYSSMILEAKWKAAEEPEREPSKAKAW